MPDPIRKVPLPDGDTANIYYSPRSAPPDCTGMAPATPSLWVLRPDGWWRLEGRSAHKAAADIAACDDWAEVVGHGLVVSPAMPAEFTHAYRITEGIEVCGRYPVQGFGHLPDGRAWYFRARGGTWSMAIGPASHRTPGYVDPAHAVWHADGVHPDGDDDAIAGIDHHHARRIIAFCIGQYLATGVPNV